MTRFHQFPHPTRSHNTEGIPFEEFSEALVNGLPVQVNFVQQEPAPAFYEQQYQLEQERYSDHPSIDIPYPFPELPQVSSGQDDHKQHYPQEPEYSEPFETALPWLLLIGHRAQGKLKSKK